MTHTLTIGEFRNLPPAQRQAVDAWLRTFTVDHLCYPDCVTYVEIHDDGLVRIRVKEWDRSAGGGIRLDPDTAKPYSITRENGSWSDGIERPELGAVPDGAVLESTFESCLDGDLPRRVAEAFGIIDPSAPHAPVLTDA